VYHADVRFLKEVALAGLVAAGLLAGGVGWLITQPTFGHPAVGPVAAVDCARLREHVRELSVACPPRSFEFPENLDRAAAYVRRDLAASGGVVADQEFVVSGERYRNVIARFGPDVGERIVVGAHYDAAEGTPGADDNASGVAALLELGRLLGAGALSLRVDLVAFTLEEPPVFRTRNMGSVRHAASLHAAGAKLRAMICLESIGCFSDAPDSQDYPSSLLRLLYPTTGSFIAVVGSTSELGLVRRIKRTMRAASPLPVRSLNGLSAIPGVDFSDHRSYWAYGYPAVMVTDTAFYRNRRYHESTDTAETLDYPRLAEVVKGVDAVVRDLAGAR
jgi:Zn-dependent M28 family amino/carboxypeptidase